MYGMIRIVDCTYTIVYRNELVLQSYMYEVLMPFDIIVCRICCRIVRKILVAFLLWVIGDKSRDKSQERQFLHVGAQYVANTFVSHSLTLRRFRVALV